MPWANATLLASIPTARWLIENQPRKLQIARLWPYLGVFGGQLAYARLENFIGAASQPECTQLGSTSEAPVQESFEFAELMTRYTFCFADQDRYRHPNNIDDVLYALAVRRLMYAYFQGLDANSGLLSLRDKMDLSNRSIDLQGAALTLECLDEAYHMVDENDGRPTVIMTSSRCLRTYHKLWFDKNRQPPKVRFQWYDPMQGQMVDGEATAFNGTPMLINDVMESAVLTEPAVQRIYFMVLGDDGNASPTRGVTGIVPDDLKHNMFIKRLTHGTHTDESTGDPQPMDSAWVSWPVGVAVPSQAAISMIGGFPPIDSCTGEDG